MLAFIGHEFYPNIWRSGSPQNEKQHIDLSQVAHIITALTDFRSEYKSPIDCNFEAENIWASKIELQPIVQDIADDALQPIPYRIQTDASVIKPLEKLGDKPEILFKCTMPPIQEPTQTNEGYLIFSPNLKDPKRLRKWSAKFLLSLHEPVHYSLHVMDGFLEQMQTKHSPSSSIRAAQTQLKAMFPWLRSYFSRLFKSVHLLKLALLPLIQIKSSVRNEIVELYQQLHDLMTQILKRERPLTASPNNPKWKGDVKNLQHMLRVFHVLFKSVTTAEEGTVEPAIRAALSKEAFQTFILPRLFRVIKKKRVILPWIVEHAKIWGGEKMYLEIQSFFELSKKFRYPSLYKPCYKANVAKPLNAMQEFAGKHGAEAKSLEQRIVPRCRFRYGKFCLIQ